MLFVDPSYGDELRGNCGGCEHTFRMTAAETRGMHHMALDFDRQGVIDGSHTGDVHVQVDHAEEWCGRCASQ